MKNIIQLVKLFHIMDHLILVKRLLSNVNGKNIEKEKLGVELLEIKFTIRLKY